MLTVQKWSINVSYYGNDTYAAGINELYIFLRSVEFDAKVIHHSMQKFSVLLFLVFFLVLKGYQIYKSLWPAVFKGQNLWSEYMASSHE